VGGSLKVRYEVWEDGGWGWFGSEFDKWNQKVKISIFPIHNMKWNRFFLRADRIGSEIDRAKSEVKSCETKSKVKLNFFSGIKAEISENQKSFSRNMWNQMVKVKLIFVNELARFFWGFLNSNSQIWDMFGAPNTQNYYEFTKICCNFEDEETVLRKYVAKWKRG
jgi:hypothetical protein